MCLGWLATGLFRRFLDSAGEEVGGQVRQVGQVGLSPAAVGRWRTPGARLGKNGNLCGEIAAVLYSTAEDVLSAGGGIDPPVGVLSGLA